MFGFGKKKDGLVKEFYDSGQKKTETNFFKGVEHGSFTCWYENGSIGLKGGFYFGHRYGFFTTLSENGSKLSEIEFDKSGDQIGLSITWYESGKIKSQCEMVNDKVHGTWIEWHENGQKKREFEAKFGHKDGKSIEWDTEGNVILVEHYKNGDLV